MESQIIIETKVLGRRKKLLDDWAVDIPPEVDDRGGNLTLRNLISYIVAGGVKAFKQRQYDNKFVRVLTERQIEEAVEKGKVDMGGRELDQQVDEDEAIGAALQAFEDGLYLVIIDGNEQKKLDKEVCVQVDSKITFIRLVMLAGG